MSEVDKLIERLEGPDYWMSGSSDGHEGINGAPVEAAATLRTQSQQIEKITDEYKEAIEQAKAQGRLEAERQIIEWLHKQPDDADVLYLINSILAGEHRGEHSASDIS